MVLLQVGCGLFRCNLLPRTILDAWSEDSLVVSIMAAIVVRIHKVDI